MFNIGPLELLVLAIVGVIVIGPDKLPNLARDAARMIKNLRELATGARQQLRDELGPEFADVDLSNLNPRTAVQRVVFGDDLDLGRLNPRTAVRDVLFGDDLKAADPRTSLRAVHDDIRGELQKPISMAKSADEAPDRPAPRPRPRPGPGRPSTPHDTDAT